MSLYACVRFKTQVKDAIGPLLNADGNYLSDNKGLCNVLNDYFATVFTEESDVKQLL
jgi:hypothetical protein